MTREVLCGDPKVVLRRLAELIFPEDEESVLGARLLARVEELVMEDARIRAALDASRYAPQTSDNSERVAQMVREHAALTGDWSRRQFSLRRETSCNPIEAEAQRLYAVGGPV